MSGLMTIGEPREDPLFERILVASAARMNLTSRGRGVLAKAVYILNGMGVDGLVHIRKHPRWPF